MSITELELYLMSLMSGHELVARWLADHALTHEHLERAATTARTKYSLDEPVHDASAYRELARGVPISSEPVSNTVAPHFVGSTKLTFELGAWPAVRFVVHAHPRGYAWGRRFEVGAQRRADLNAVRPWAWTRDALTVAADTHAVLDEWTEYAELRFTVGDKVYRGIFDLDLLQRWTPVSAGSS